MTDTKKVIKALLEGLIVQIDAQNSSIYMQKELDNQTNPSIHSVKKGVENG